MTSKTLEFVLKASKTQLVKYHLQCENEDGKTPLRYAIEEVIANIGHCDIVEALLKRGASLEETSKAPSRYPGGLFQTKTSLRTTAMLSTRYDLRELVAKY
jgi:ankyrin repeat protein